jgi:putative membrane protein
MRPWLAEADKQAIRSAVSYIESLSAVEVVVVVRRRSRPWTHIPFIAGGLAVWLTLALMLFTAPAFSLASFLVDPFLVGAAVGWAASRLPPTIRWFTPSAVRRRAVMTAANDTFVERGVHRTRGRTGVLVYCALGERMAAVIVDTAVAAGVAPGRLAAWRDQIEATIRRGPQPVASVIAAMAPVFAAALPRLQDDVNELADAVSVDLGSRQL